MSGFKGTPGPWSCAYNGYFFDIKPKGSHQDLAITHANEHIGIDNVIEEANANLIAAAPELLEALRQLRDYVEDVCEVSLVDCDEQHPLMLATAALKKALGQ